MKTSTIDLFCGIGGLSFGLQKAGVNIVAGLDFDDSCRYSYENNIHAEFLSRDVTQVDGSVLIEKYWNTTDNVKILAGCAPCQPFSSYSNKNKNREKSKKWFLLDEFKRLVEQTNPEIVTMENVPNLANQKIFGDFVQFLITKKYFVSYSNVYCPDYGIPQKRRRLVLLASKRGEISILPKTHKKEDYLTLKDAIGEFPPIEAGEICKSDPLHRTQKLSKRNLDRIRASKPDGSWLDWDDDLRLACHKKNSGATFKSVYGRLSWDEPSSTITTQFYNVGTGRFGHPSQDRSLSLREAAILQTFPLDYKFYESEKDILIRKLGMHIGNAVPVDLGFIIGKSIIKHLGGIE